MFVDLIIKKVEIFLKNTSYVMNSAKKNYEIQKTVFLKKMKKMLYQDYKQLLT